MTGINVFSNGEIKSIDFTPWGGIQGFLDSTSNGADIGNVNKLRKLVPWLQKGINMTANAVAQLPYTIDDLELNIAWGGVKNPQTLIALIAASLCGGKAYCLADTTSKAIVNIQYLAPQTIQCNFDSNGEIKSFTRTTGTMTQTLLPEQVIYFWLPDDTIETGPAQITPIQNSILSAGLMAAMDDSLRQYGERGFIPPILLGTKGMANKGEIERTETWWNNFLRGWTKTIAKIVNSEALTVTTLGAGMEELKGSYIEITRQQIENIATSFGIPAAVFMSDQAYATEMNAMIRVWYSSSIFVSIYQTIEDTFTDQLFSRFGKSMEFDPESLDAFQEDEERKSTSLSSLSDTFATNPEASLIAADILHYGLTDEQIAKITALKENKPEPQPIPPQLVANQELPTDEENDIAEELRAWRKFTEKPRKRGFETKHIPPALALRINTELRNAKSQDEIQTVFDGATMELPIIRLAKALEAAQ